MTEPTSTPDEGLRGMVALLADHDDCGIVNPDNGDPIRWTCGIEVERPDPDSTVGWVDLHREHVAKALLAARPEPVLTPTVDLADPILLDHATCSCSLRVLDHDVVGAPCGETSAQALATWIRSQVAEPVPAPDSEGIRVARVLRHLADLMLHQTDVADEDLRSRIDNWAGALHGAVTLLAPDSAADDTGVGCKCPCHETTLNGSLAPHAGPCACTMLTGEALDVMNDVNAGDTTSIHALMNADPLAADDTGAGEREPRQAGPRPSVVCEHEPVCRRREDGWPQCAAPFLPATPDADDTPPPAAGEVEAADAKWALTFAIIRELPLSPDGTGHVNDCGWDDNRGKCGCFTLPERIATLLKADRAARDAEVGERIARAKDEEREAWSSWLDNWISAVGPEPPTVEAVANWLRAEQRPFGIARGVTS